MKVTYTVTNKFGRQVATMILDACNIGTLDDGEILAMDDRQKVALQIFPGSDCKIDEKERTE